MPITSNVMTTITINGLCKLGDLMDEISRLLNSGAFDRESNVHFDYYKGDQRDPATLTMRIK